MKLASGPARIGSTKAAGVTIGLGSDGEKENNALDLFEEMELASRLQKVTTLDPIIGDPWDMLAVASIDAARAPGLDGVTGSLEAGNAAEELFERRRAVLAAEGRSPGDGAPPPGRDAEVPA